MHNACMTGEPSIRRQLEDSRVHDEGESLALIGTRCVIGSGDGQRERRMSVLQKLDLDPVDQAGTDAGSAQ